MSAKVLLEITEGALKGKESAIKSRTDGGVTLKDGQIVIEEHDLVVFGRNEDCHIQFPKDDGQISRHHFILEANPPDMRVRDLGSLNGTHIKHAAGGQWEEIGRRKKGESPEEGGRRRYKDVDLVDGDNIQVGETVITLHVKTQATCQQCGVEIAERDLAACAWPGGAFLCAKCRQEAAASVPDGKRVVCPDCKREVGPGKAAFGGKHEDDCYCRECWEIGYKTLAPARERFHRQPLRCRKCGQDVEGEVGSVRRGDYVCAACQEKAADNPADLLCMMLRQAGLIAEGKGKPEVPGYELGDCIGRGGFGAVYVARRLKDGAQVAVKVMLSKVAVSEKARNDFRREIEVTRALKQHPNIVMLLDHGAAGTGFYFVMEYYPEGSVTGLMRRKGGRLDIAEAGPIMLQSLDGLIYMHGEKFVHRDLKPDNLLLGRQGGGVVAKISDLGLAKNFERSGFSGCTVTGQYAGTYCFMPREQLTNFKYVKPVSDIWSLGATFYNMLTGCLPHDFPRGKDQAGIVLNEDIVPIRERCSSLPKSLADTIDRAVAKEAKDRYQTALEFRSAIANAL